MLRECCQDKTSPYDIRPVEASLFRAAIELAALLLQSEVTAQQHSAIADMLAFLRNLPAPPPAGLNGEFGFEFESNSAPSNGSHAGCWVVSVCRGMIEVYSSGTEPLAEFSWALCPGQLNHNDLSRAGEWIKQVSDPYAFLPNDHHLVVEAATWSVTAS